MVVSIMIELINRQFLDSILETTKSSAHIKDIKSGKYLESNTINITKFGFNKTSDIIGLTINDLDSFMSNFWGSCIVFEVNMLENKAIETMKPVKENRVFLDADGMLFKHDMTKIPIVGSSNSVSSIFTLSDDITNELSLIEILDYYIHFYNSKKNAVQRFLRHVNVVDLFNEMPTDAEVRVLIAKINYITSKRIAIELNISPKTVENHIASLKERTKIDLISLSNLLSKWALR
jgi:hypothetical protein